MASFLDQQDPTTEGHYLLSRQDVQKAVLKASPGSVHPLGPRPWYVVAGKPSYAEAVLQILQHLQGCVSS